MKYDGVVVRLESLYLFILNPDTNKIMDGINISEHDSYKDMTESQLMVVNVIFKDGTQEIDKLDLDDFIYGDTYGLYDVFLHIQDLMLFSIGEKNSDPDVSLSNLSDVIDKGEFDSVAIECIELVKKQMNKNKDE